MDVADLGSSGTEFLTRRGVFALHESRVGEKVLDSGETMDVVDLVEDGQCEDLADAGCCS